MRLAVGIGAAEADQAAEAGDGVVVDVLGRDGERERTSRDGRGRRPGDREVIEGVRSDEDPRARARGRVETRGNRLVADLRQRRAEGARARGQAACGRQMCLAIGVGAGEADLSPKAGDRIVVHILGGDRERKRMSRDAGRRRPGDREMIERLTGVIVMALLVPIAGPSFAVMVWLPAVVKVALKLPTPFVKAPAAGRLVSAPISVLLKATVPLKPVSVLPNESCAVTVNENEVPATVGDVGVPVTAK